jgi:hypothetical protein
MYIFLVPDLYNALLTYAQRRQEGFRCSYCLFFKMKFDKPRHLVFPPGLIESHPGEIYGEGDQRKVVIKHIWKQQGLAERIKQYKWHKILGIEVTNSHKH